MAQNAPLTWVLSKKIPEQNFVGPGEDISEAHGVWDVPAEALSDVLLKEISIRVSLAVRQQQQHPHESDVNCKEQTMHWTWTVMRPLAETTESGLRISLFYRMKTHKNSYWLKNSLRKAKAFCSRILLFLILSMSAGAGGWYRLLPCLTACTSFLHSPAGKSTLFRNRFNSKTQIWHPGRGSFMIFYLDGCCFLQPPYADNLPPPPSLEPTQRRRQETPPVMMG